MIESRGAGHLNRLDLCSLNEIALCLENLKYAADNLKNVAYNSTDVQLEDGSGKVTDIAHKAFYKITDIRRQD